MTSHPLPPHITAWLCDAFRHLARAGLLGRALTIPDLLASGIPLPPGASGPRQAKAAINRVLYRAFARCEGDWLPVGAFTITRSIHPPRSAAYTFHLARPMLASPVNNR